MWLLMTPTCNAVAPGQQRETQNGAAQFEDNADRLQKHDIDFT